MHFYRNEFRCWNIDIFILNIVKKVELGKDRVKYYVGKNEKISLKRTKHLADKMQSHNPE